MFDCVGVFVYLFMLALYLCILFVCVCARVWCSAATVNWNWWTVRVIERLGRRQRDGYRDRQEGCERLKWNGGQCTPPLHIERIVTGLHRYAEPRLALRCRSSIVYNRVISNMSNTMEKHIRINQRDLIWLNGSINNYFTHHQYQELQI